MTSRIKDAPAAFSRDAERSARPERSAPRRGYARVVGISVPGLRPRHPPARRDQPAAGREGGHPRRPLGRHRQRRLDDQRVGEQPEEAAGVARRVQRVRVAAVGGGEPLLQQRGGGRQREERPADARRQPGDQAEHRRVGVVRDQGRVGLQPAERRDQR